MENRHLLDVDKFKELSRTISRHVEEEDILKYIRECEDVCIIPSIGLEMFKKSLQTQCYRRVANIT